MRLVLLPIAIGPRHPPHHDMLTLTLVDPMVYHACYLLMGHYTSILHSDDLYDGHRVAPELKDVKKRSNHLHPYSKEWIVRAHINL